MSEVPADGALADAVSEKVARLFLDHFGKGPIEIKTSIRGDVVVTLMHDVLTAAERTLIDDGKADRVLTTRMLWQQATEQTFRDEIGRVMGREVVAVISGVELRRAMASETFVLAPRADANMPA